LGNLSAAKQRVCRESANTESLFVERHDPTANVDGQLLACNLANILKAASIKEF